jgi:fatty-acid desaturase
MTRLLVPPEAGHVEFAPGKTLWLYASLAGGALVVFFPPSAPAWATSAVLGLLTLCLGHSVGLHRGVIHGAYRCSPWLRGLLVYLFVHTGIGGPLSWVRLHYVRDYYQNQSECPRYFGYRHALWRDYFWNLHLRFVPRDEAIYGLPGALLQDRWLGFLERTWPLHVLGLFGALWWGFGVSVAAACVGVRVFVSVTGHWCVGFLAHKRGYVRYELDGSSEIGRNLPLLGVLSFGEGFHNNHHANPGSARMGETRREIDLGWYALLLLERLGLVTELCATGRSPDVKRQNARRVATAWVSARHGPQPGGVH